MPKENKKRVKQPPISELSLFCSQLSLFMHSGINMSEGLLLLLEDLEPGRLKTAVQNVLDSMNEGMTLTQSMENSGAFPEYFIKMTAVGEVSGTLDETFRQLSAYYERQIALKKRIKNAVAYPVVLLILMVAVFLVLIVRVLPMFNDILRSLGGQLPGFAQGLMNFGSWLGRYLLWIIAAIVILVIVLKLLFASKGGKRLKNKLAATLPGFRGVTRKLAAERFSLAMSALLKSGVDIVAAFELSRDIMENSWYAEKIDDCIKSSRESGESIYDVLFQMEIFPRLYGRMLSVGVKAGDVDGMFTRLSVLYGQQADDSLRKMTGAIEPACVGLLSIAVGAILISVMLPLVSIMSSIG